MLNTYKNYIITVVLAALVFMPFFGISFSVTPTSVSAISTYLVKHNPITIVTVLANPQIVNEPSSLCSKGVLFNLNQSGDCFAKIAINLRSSAPVYSVVVTPWEKLVTTVSVIRLWFTNPAVINGFEAFPIILASLISILLVFILVSRRSLFAYSSVFETFYSKNLSLSLLQVYRC